MSKILVVYYQALRSDRNTINEHLYSFGRYANADVWHYNACAGIPGTLASVDFDLIVFHYTFLARRWNGRGEMRRLMKSVSSLAKSRAKKIAFPQDEYIHTTALCEFLSEFKIDALFTCHNRSDWEKVYPREKIGHAAIFQTFTGYVENRAIESTKLLWKPHRERKFDVGYRARFVPFWLGKQGTLKWRLTEEFKPVALRYDIHANLSNDINDVFLGEDWYRFLADCRVVLGCEGGATLLDPDGIIRARVDAFCSQHPQATFAETEKACFPDLDDGIQLKAISPRHFEATLTKTCQALVEGGFEGIFKPDVHYIPIEKDFSNLDEVARKIQDIAYCEQLAEQAYKDIVVNGEYTYAHFVKDVLKKIEINDNRSASENGSPVREFLTRNSLRINNLVFVPLARLKFSLKAIGFRAMAALGLVDFYRSLRRRYFAWED